MTIYKTIYLNYFRYFQFTGNSIILGLDISHTKRIPIIAAETLPLPHKWLGKGKFYQYRRHTKKNRERIAGPLDKL